MDDLPLMYRDPIYAEAERLRNERDRLVEALALSRPAPPVRKRYKQTPDERLVTVVFGWGGFILGFAVGAGSLVGNTTMLGTAGGITAVGAVTGLLGGALAVVAVLFTQWALRISP